MAKRLGASHRSPDARNLASDLSVTPGDVARGWRLWEVRTNAAPCFVMPDGATLATNWWAHGAYEDVVRVLPDDPAVFNFLPPAQDGGSGSSAPACLWAYTNGRVRPRLRDALHEIAAVGAPMSAVPGVSRFWTATTTNGTFLLTWQDFACGRIAKSAGPDGASFLSAQVEFFPNGDFVTRSNAVERAYCRLDRNDWDGDGWHNADDPDPFVRNPPPDGFCQELSDGANPNAYCWIDVCCDYAASVTFTGDGFSNLVDPDFTAAARQTNRVSLLIGKSYTVEASRPIAVVGRSDARIEVTRSGACAFEVRRPVVLMAEGGTTPRGGGPLRPAPIPSARPSDVGDGSFRMSVEPANLGGAFEWAYSCCRVWGTGTVFRIDCRRGCGCCGCWAYGQYAYEGYALPAEGGTCGCWWDSDGDGPRPRRAGADVAFSARTVIFEAPYEDAPGVWKPGGSTETELRCEVRGGPYGGRAEIEFLSGGERLAPRDARPVPAYAYLGPDGIFAFTNRYGGAAASDRQGDIVVRATFTENETGWTSVSTATATVVRVEVRTKVHAPENDRDFRHKFGVGEIVSCKTNPEISFVNLKKTGSGFFNRTNEDDAFEYRCPLRAETNGFLIVGDGCQYIPQTSVVEPQGVLARNVSYEVSTNVCQGQAGGILLKQNLYVLPLDVSFSRIRIEEVPDAGGEMSGYFSDAYFISVWTHGVDQGAGKWHKVYGSNLFLPDEAGFDAALPQLDSAGAVSIGGTNGWSPGMLMWKVPCGWAKLNVENGDDPIGTFAIDAKQIMTINATGSVEVQKYGNAVRRNIDGGVILNGVRMR